MDTTGSLSRGLHILRLLGEGGQEGRRLSDIADTACLPRPTAHRILRMLVVEGFVEHDAAARRYRLGLPLFLLASRAGNPAGLRDLCRPALLRLTASLGETVFLMVHNGYDAICIDRSAGPLPIRSFTGDIGGRVPLGLGQGSTAILACLPPEEQDEIIAHNLPLIRDLGGSDEDVLRAEIRRVRQEGYSIMPGVLPGMAGLGVPLRDQDGRAVGALSIGTTTDRLGPERLELVAGLLQKEAGDIATRLNPFDPVLRRAGAAMEASPAR
jgi:DNA-binding IclR family transcriptional regulator